MILRTTILKLTAILTIMVLSSSTLTCGHAYEISQESKKMVDSYLEPGFMVLDPMSGEMFPPGTISVDAIDYLIDILFSNDREINRRYIISMIANVYESHKEQLKDYGLDDLMIKFIESQESSKQYDSVFYGNVYGCLRMLGKIRNAKAVQFLTARTALDHWASKSISVYDSKRDRIDLDEVRYRKQQREAAIHVLCLIPDATAETFVNEFSVSKTDPDFRNLQKSKNFHQFEVMRENTLRKHKGLKHEQYKEMFNNLFNLECSLEAYYLDHKDYPKNLNEIQVYFDKIPTDSFRSDGLFYYQKIEQGYKLWSVGPNGKTDEPGSKDFDDIIVQYP